MAEILKDTRNFGTAPKEENNSETPFGPELRDDDSPPSKESNQNTEYLDFLYERSFGTKPKETEINSAEYDGKERFVIDFKDGTRLTAPQIEQMFNESGTAPETFVGSATSRMITDYIKKNNPTRDQFIKHFSSVDLNKGGVIPMNNQMQQFAEGGLKDEGGEVDEVSGNEVPIGGTKEGVRDDIPANVSEGEFIFPADVVRFIGLDKLMQIRQDAKMGLKKMEAMGQMGNSDEATVDDDMPFEMADLMVVSSDDTPMKFAGGGFIPVEDYTVVQDMIEDRSDKAAAIDKDQAMREMMADNTTKSAAVDKTQEEEVQNFFHGGVAHSGSTLDTADVPTTDANKVIDYDAYMDSVITEIKEYRNEAGEKINITFINGVAFPPIPVGFTLYVPVDAEAPTEESEIAAVINNNNDDDKGSNRTPSLPPINYAGMSNEDFAKRMEYENTTGYQVQKNIGLAISAMVPFGLGLAYGSMRSHARASEERLNAMIKSAKTPEEAARLSGIRDGVLKNASLKSTEESTAIAKWVDGWLIGKGYNPNLAAAGANFVNNVNSQGVLSESSVETGTANTAANNAGDLAATQNSFLPKETVQSEEYFEDKLSGNIDDFKKSKTNVIIERLKPGGGKPELAGVNYGVPVNRGEITAVRKYLESLASAEGGAFVGGRETASTKAQERLDKFNTLVESATEAGRTVDNADGFFEGPNNPSYEQVAQDARLFGYNPRTGRQIITVPKKNKNDPQLYFTPNDAANTRSNTMPTNVKSGRDSMDEASRGPYQRFKDLNPTPEAINNFYSTTNTNATYDNPTDSRDIKRDVEASNYYESGAGRDGATSAVLPRTIKSYEAPSSDMSGLDQLAQERFASAQNAYNAPEVPASVADSSRMLKINQPLGGSQQETFNQAFNRNRLAGAEVFTHTDGKVYSTKTVEERNAEVASTRPNTGFQDLANLLTKDDGRSYTGGILRNEAGDRVNSAYQNAANALTPGDGKAYKAGVLKNKAGATVNSFYQNAANNLTPNDGRSYVNGVLLDDTTKEPYVEKTKKPSDNIYSVEYGYTGSGVNDVAIGKISDGKTSGVLADKDGKVIRDDNNRTVYVDQSGKQYVKTDLFGMSTQAPTGTIVTQQEDDGQSKQADPVVKVSPQPVKKEDNSGEREANRAANKAAAKAEKTQQDAGRTESFEQKIKRGGGFNKGGLASKPKAKKTKTTNKRGLAARK